MGRNSLVEEKRRLEARVAQLEEEMDEAHSELEQTSEKSRKSAAQVNHFIISHHDIAIQWEWSNFDPSQNPNPLTDYDKTLHN